jgi:PTH2 family peptidyl-tRNA hydrolase
MEYKQAIVVRKDLGMGTGKIAAQSSHASVEALEKAKQKYPEWVEEWKAHGQGKIVLKVQSKKELVELFEQMKRTLPCALVHDAGHTQVTPGEITCFACGPAPESEINKFTGKLKLL